ncbi:fungal-specific transcription factor domain-containing protein [Xylaria sp. CBS 124048]|nr:fungal-specific transcription factor domain-containing protein [Xylaria sp. CBS 124048]
MASEQHPGLVSGPSPGYKRASRKGAPKKFTCDWPDCDKVYSRHEHLQRHQLNHEPKQIYKCDVSGCNQVFVRQDLLLRHKKRHSSAYVPRNRASSFNIPAKADEDRVSSPRIANNGQSASLPSMTPPIPSPPGSDLPPTSAPKPGSLQIPAGFKRLQPSMPRNASVLLSPNSAVTPSSATSVGSMGHISAWPQPMSGVDMIPPKPTYHYPHNDSPFMSFPDLQLPQDSKDHPSPNFAFWLFDNQCNYGDFNVADLSFLDGGLESPFNNTIHYDQDSLASRSQIGQTPPGHTEVPDELISDSRRLEIVNWIKMFRQKQNQYDPKLDGLLQESSNDLPYIHLDFLHDCVRHYWDIISPRLPIVHQPTFSPTRCAIHLLLVMIALGAAQIHRESANGDYEEYKALADLIITSIRLEILNDDDASPPVNLWAAQALLLVEFYEKMYSTRKLHERGHIYHCVTLNLLRRGSPLIGKAGLESPPSEQSSVDPGTDDCTWWARWADTEAMHRVVFAAFMMDIINAAMFGHAADMGPHEIRLPLPCDDALWSAPSHEIVRQQEANLRMYGVKPIIFLDGLKRALHGQEVKTHSFGRMIIMCGLLSVGWHLRHRETHLKWLEIAPNAAERRDRWCSMLLKAFDDWKTSFDDAIGSNGMSSTDSNGQGQPAVNGLIQSAAVLYHLAHLSLYIDIIDCQVYAGAKRLLGRKISSRDLVNVNSRMVAWAGQPVTRRAMSHAFKLLYRILVDPRQRKITPTQELSGNSIQYSTRADPDPHRPWIMYYATLSIWCFTQALNNGQNQPVERYGLTTVPEYLSRISKLSEIDPTTAKTLREGLLELLDVVCPLLSQSHSELLKEACQRLGNCKEIMFGGETT